MTQIIELIVSPSGTIQLETKGFDGFVCRRASRPLEKALGRLTGEKLTSEYYLPPATTGCTTKARE